MLPILKQSPYKSPYTGDTFAQVSACLSKASKMNIESVSQIGDEPLLIESRIFIIRGQKVLLDSDLATLYQVTTGNFNKAVQRNRKRFPEDFMFQLTRDEDAALRFQNGISNEVAAPKVPALCIPEQGVAMLSSVLRSERAIEVNIAIMRTFVRLRQLLATHEELARRLEQLEWRQNEQGHQIQAVFETIQHLIEGPTKPTETRRIAFPTSSTSRRSTI